MQGNVCWFTKNIDCWQQTIITFNRSSWLVLNQSYQRTTRTLSGSTKARAATSVSQVMARDSQYRSGAERSASCGACIPVRWFQHQAEIYNIVNLSQHWLSISISDWSSLLIDSIQYLTFEVKTTAEIYFRWSKNEVFVPFVTPL